MSIPPRIPMLYQLSRLAMSPGGVLAGLLVGILGLLIGIFGFWLTLNQIKKVKNVAEAQQAAITNLKIRFSQLDTVQECAKAERALNDIKSSLLTTDLDVPLTSFDVLLISLVNILEGCTLLSDTIVDRLKSAISEINRMSETAARGKTTRATSAKQAAAFREYHGLLVKIRTHVQQEQQV